MNKKFLQKLLSKPDKYILVWCYIYSRLDSKNEAIIYSSELQGRFELPKSTMKRIVNFGVESSNVKINIKWASKNLHISVLDTPNDFSVKEEVKPHKKKIVRKTTRKPATTLYSKMVEEYDTFCEKFTGVGCKIDGAQGKSLKQIIKFLQTQCKKKNQSLTETQLDENVILSWQYILTNWDKLDDFHRSKIKLTEINSNMLNILIKLKEQPISNKQKQRNEQISKAISGASNTDYSRLGS